MCQGINQQKPGQKLIKYSNMIYYLIIVRLKTIFCSLMKHTQINVKTKERKTQ